MTDRDPSLPVEVDLGMGFAESLVDPVDQAGQVDLVVQAVLAWAAAERDLLAGTEVDTG